MKIYAIADLHLAQDEKLNKPMNVFGPGWEDHPARLQENWDEMVSPEDVVLLPGDLSWGMKLQEAEADLRWIHERPGIKLLVKGNHDLWWAGITMLNSLYDDMHFIQNDCHYIESESIAIAGTRGWPYPGSDEYSEHDEKIYRRELGRLESSLKAAVATGADEIIAMLHYPPAGEWNRRTEFTDLLEKYGVSKCIYGHLHGANVWQRGIRGEQNGVEYMLVSLDYLGAMPKLIYDGKKDEL